MVVLALAAACFMVFFFAGLRETGDPWRIGVQAWSFNRFSFYEAVDKAAELGVDCIEAFPGQKLSPDEPGESFHHGMSPEKRRQVLDKLEKSGIDLVNYGVVGLPPDEEKCREVFDFAKAMGIETIVSEPVPEALDLIDQLCNEYGIRVALHNHPKPSRYWDPQAVLDAVKDRSPMMGACADTGHWMRSGIRPVEALRLLSGRVVTFHLKDLNEFGEIKAHDVPWGAGKADIKAVLKEMANQEYRGVFAVEYEHNWEDSMEEIGKCVSFFRETAASL
jgi:sugar phosphate isomerase/epimerase